MDDEQISKDAENYIKKNSRSLIDAFIPSDIRNPATEPVTLFMAGSPGAGKTEFSIRLIETFDQKPVRIDADEIRKFCPGYNGTNAHLFQKAANKGVNILYDYALDNKINVIMDGTFAYGLAESNIDRSIKRNRKTEIFYIYQDPIIAWDITQKREVLEKRRVSKDVFIKAFFKSKSNVRDVKNKFGSKVEVNMIIKDITKDIEKLHLNIHDIDPYVSQVYTENELIQILNESLN